MEGWLIIVLISIVLFVGFIIYDKRKFIADKIKKIFKKPLKKEKEPKVKQPKEKVVKQKKQKQPKKKKTQPEQETTEEIIDYDKMVLEDNIVYGQEPVIQQNPMFTTEEETNNEDIDIDELFEQIRRQESELNQQSSQSNNFDTFNNDDFDEFFENEFSFDDFSDSAKDSFRKMGYDKNLTGKELGEMIKSLPSEIKAIIITDLLKPKF